MKCGVRQAVISLFLFWVGGATSAFSVEMRPGNEVTYCDDLYKPSRLEREVTDPTGSATNLLSSQYERRFNEVFSANLPIRLLSDYRRILSRRSPDAHFIDELFNARGFRQWAECRDVDPFLLKGSALPNACVEVLASFLADFTQRRLLDYYLVSFENEGEREEIQNLMKVVKSSIVRGVESTALAMLTHSLVTPQISKTIRKNKTGVFARVLGIMRAKIRSDFSDRPDVRKNFLSRLELISFDGFDCSKVSRVDLVQAVSFNFFLTQDQKILFCPGSLRRNQSEYSWVWWLAHEIAHVLGPCRLQTLKVRSDFVDLNLRYPEKGSRDDHLRLHPYGETLSCLTKDSAAGARDQLSLFGNSSASEFCADSEGGVDEGRDQIDETFSDWMATEVLNEYMKVTFAEHTVEEKRLGLTNVFRGMEGFTGNRPEQLKETSVRLSAKERLNRVLFAHPGIREQVGCSERAYPVQYCSSK
jgi:hypothetical protein